MVMVKSKALPTKNITLFMGFSQLGGLRVVRSGEPMADGHLMFVCEF